MLNVDNMSGNTFLNFFLLSVIEGPAYFLGVWLSVRVQMTSRSYLSLLSCLRGRP